MPSQKKKKKESNLSPTYPLKTFLSNIPKSLLIETTYTQFFEPEFLKTYITQKLKNNKKE